MKINNKIQWQVLVWVLLVLLAYPLSAQNNSITLEASKKAALNYSRAIKNGSIRIEQAAAAKKEALSHYFPTISATGVAIYGFDDLIPAMPGLLPQGISNMYFASASANEVLFAGGKIKNANVLSGLQADMYSIRAQQATDSVLLLTEQKFWQLVQLQEQLKVLESSKVYLNEVLKQQQDLLDAGLIAKNDMLKVKVEKNRLLLNQSKLNNTRKIALLDFALYVGIPFDTTMVAKEEFAAIDNPELKYMNPDTSLVSNTNYKLLTKAVEAKRLQTKLEKADLMPSVMVGVAGTQYGTFDNSLDSNFVPIAMGTVSIPISDWWGAGRYKVKQKQLEEKIAVNKLEDVKDQLHIGIMQSWYNVTDAYKQIEFATINKEQAQENLNVHTNNYEQGLASLSDLLDAQRLYQQAAAELVNAYANFKNREAEYLYITSAMNN